MTCSSRRTVSILFFIFILSLLPVVLAAQITVTIRPNGGTTWALTRGAANITGPGASFATPVQSAANAYFIRVQNSTVGSNWQIYVQRDHPATWIDAMRLYVQRVTNNANVWGGQPYVYIPYAGEVFAPNPNAFFGGTTNITNIYVQLQVDLPMSSLYTGLKTTTIIYTITEV